MAGLDRRTLLAAAAFAAAATTLRGQAAATDDARRPVDIDSGDSMALARHVSLAPLDTVPAEALRMARLSILDAIGVSMAAAGDEPACKPFLEQAFEEGVGGPAVVLGTGRRSSIGLAALANGALAHALDYEDAHDPSRTHPNAAPVAAAVALASARRGISGRDFLMAVALGADVACRSSMAQGNVDVLPKAFYPPAIAGTMGATATAARLLALTPAQTLDAFSIALCQNATSAEILSDAYSDLRAVRDGFSAQVAVQAAQLARRGVKGFARPFEGERAFFAMYADGRQQPGVLTAQLGQRYEGQFVGYKAWPACRDNHPYIQAVLEGQGRDRLDPAQIDALHAWVPRRSLIVCEPRAEKRRPRAAIDAKFSLYFTVAHTLLHGAPGLASYGPASLGDPATLALAARVDYTVDTGPALLEVRLKDGSRRLWNIDGLYGSPENPMDEQALVAKFIDCALASPRRLPAAKAAPLAQQLLRIDGHADLQPLLRRL